MLQKIINYIAQILGIKKKKINTEEENKNNKKNPDDIYPLW